MTAPRVASQEPCLAGLYRPSAQSASSRLEAALLPQLRLTARALLEHAPPRWAQQLLASTLANLCVALEGSLHLPERKLRRRDLPLLHADLDALGAFFHTELGVIDRQAVGATMSYLYSICDDACVAPDAEPARPEAKARGGGSHWGLRKNPGR